jgi:hypothetical protein
MIFVFISSLIILLVVGAYLSRLRQATLHWGRHIAGLDYIRREIDEAKAADPEKAAELLERSVHQRGFQDAITPPWQTTFTFLHWGLCIVTYVWGFFILPWYVAALWPVPFGIIKRSVGNKLPSPDSHFYRQKLISGLESRCEQFERTGDDMRLGAAAHMIALLHGDENV